ncbi:MAG TPA: fatty acid--CoA ligase FadD11, partial [Mycobacterium sp.]|nr:fatty acid--CoA ligase FadD11 [Mycobacterium sp.]
MATTEPPTTLCAAFQRTAAIDPDAVALRTPGGTQTLTWRDYAAQVRRVAAGLAGLGVQRGDTVSLMMANRIEFYPLEVGAQHVGATSFSVYNTLPATEIAYLLGNAGTTVVMCEESYVDRIRASGVALEHIVCIDGKPEGTLSVDDLLAAGADDFDFESAWRAVQPDDIVTLIYTSGTTGHPKGVEMTHTNLLFEANAVHGVLGVRFGDRITSFLPSAHVADRVSALYNQEVFGVQVTVVDDPTAIAAALTDVRPTIWAAVPRVWEKLKAAIEFAVDNEPDEDRQLALQWALAVGAKRAAALIAGTPVPDDVAAEWATADELVLSKLRAKLGLDQLRWAVSGAAPIPKETLGFFAGIGIPIAEVWGMSELSCVASTIHPREARLGTVGKLLPGLESRIAEDGEFLVRGPLVMRGYRKEPGKTAEAIDADGWLHTGDILQQDADRYLRIVDRKKELIINAAGKNMSPANIQNAILAACPLIGAMVAIGDARPYNTALLVFDADSVGPYAARHGLADASPAALAAHPAVIAAIAAGVADGNTKLSRVEQIKRFRVLPTLWEPGGDE